MKNVTITVTETERFGERKLRPGDTIEVPADHHLAQVYGNKPASPAAGAAPAKAVQNAGRD